MRLIYIILLILITSKIAFSENLFETSKYILKFDSNNISQIKEKKIDEIKIKSFKNILKKILTNQNYRILNSNDISFVNKFILNIKINNEKIINNNYYSEIRINFNIDLIFDYLINKKIKYIDHSPQKFLIIIFEQKEIKSYLLSKENNFYKYLINSTNESFNEIFLIPKLDYNDRYLFNKNHFINDTFNQNNLLNKKYNTKYQVLIDSSIESNYFVNKVYLFYENEKHLIYDNKIHKLNYEDFFTEISLRSLDKWKQINQIDITVVNTLECKISINNYNELVYVRNLIQSNRIVKSLSLKSIKLNENLYQIIFFDNINHFMNSLTKDRLRLEIYNKTCHIKLI